METRRQGVTLFTALCLLIGIVVIVQLWLVAASLEAFLSRDMRVLAPAAVASLALFLINFGLLQYVRAFDLRLRRAKPHD